MLPRTARTTNFVTSCPLSCLCTAARMSYFVSGVLPLQRQQWGLICNFPRGCLTILTQRDAIIPVVRRLGCSTPHNVIYLDNHQGGMARKKRYRSCLTHAVIVMFYSVGYKRGQPLYKFNFVGAGGACLGTNRSTVYHAAPAIQ